MKSIEIQKANGAGTTIYHRFPKGNDIVSTAENDNLYIGNIKAANIINDFVVDGNTFYYQVKDETIGKKVNLLLNPKEEKSAVRSGSNQFIDWAYKPELKESNTTLFTISCWAKREPGSTVSDMDFYFRGYNGQAISDNYFGWRLTDEYQYYTATFVVYPNKTFDDMELCCFRTSQGSGRFYIKDVMLTQNIETPYWQKIYLRRGE